MADDVSHEILVELMADARDTLLAMLDKHEHKRHGGEPCWATRAGMIAYLMHAFGIPAGVYMAVIEMKELYDAECPGRSCPSPAPRPVHDRPAGLN